jgi:SOS-response transcriptional repressor LexA
MVSMLNMKQLNERLRHALTRISASQTELAKACGVTKGAVSQWLNGTVRTLEGMNLISAAKFLKVRPEWLADGTIPMLYGMDETGIDNIKLGITIPRPRRSQDINVEPGPNISGKVPLISWVQAGAFCQAPDLFAPGDAEEWLLSVQKLGPHAYALRVNGDSMTAPYGRSYPDGCIIFVDPDCPITNGCRVIAKLPDTHEATFKCYVEDAGKKFLKPLNPQYPTIEITDTMLLCGVVKGYYMPD